MILAVKYLGIHRFPLLGANKSAGSQNRGAFHDFIALIAEWSPEVRDLQKTRPKNGHYQSTESQNEIIEDIASCIRKTISEEVRNSKYISVMMNEGKDCSRREQGAVCIRHLKIGDDELL